MSIAKYLAKLAQGIDATGQLSNTKISGGYDSTPTITGIAYPGDDTATDPAGGQTITLTGNNFANGAKVIINGAAAGVVTVVSTTQLTFTAPANPAGSYILYVVNTNGGTAIAAPGIQYSALPVFTAAAGTLGTLYETQAVSTITAATSDSAITYYLQSGNLPPGITLDSASGIISGSSSATAASTTYTFTIRATDGQQQDGIREFSLTINPDVIVWTNPVSGGTLSAYQGVATVIPVTTATGTGTNVVYSATNTPPGMVLAGDVFTGTPTTIGNTSATITGTTVATARSSQINFTWSISVQGDTYWPQTTVLFQGTATSGVDHFATDTSPNNNFVTVVGDTRPSKQNPYQQGYYSNYFDGTGDYLTTATNAVFAFGTADFTMECWFYTQTLGLSQKLITFYPSAVLSGYNAIYINTANKVLYGANGADQITGTTTINAGVWYHLAAVRQSGVTKLYLNGVQEGSNYTDSTSYLTARPAIGTDGYSVNSNNFYGYISNARVVKGTAVYTTAFPTTVPTAPLTAITNTSLLTCQSARLIDNSINNFAITKVGDTTVVPFNPFGVPATANTNNLYSTYFDGTGDYISATPAAIGTSEFGIEGWFYTGDVSIGKYIVSLGFNSNNSLFFAVQSGQVQLTVQDNAGAFPLNNVNIGTPVANTWNYFYVGRGATTAGTATWYYGLNGTVSSQTAASPTFPSRNFEVGYAPTRALGSAYFNGYISNVRLIVGSTPYTASFTPSTTPLTAVANTQLLLCQSSTLRDNSTNASVVTSFGDARPVAVTPFTQTTSSVALANIGSTYFDGTGDYLTTGIPAISANDFTIEYYSYLTAHSGTNGEGGYLQISDTAGGLKTTYTSGIYAARATPGNGQVLVVNVLGTVILTTYVLPLNQWFHTAIVRQSGSVRVYVNGVLVSTPTAVAGSITGTFLAIGGMYSTAYLMTGYVSNFRLISNTCIYTSNFDVPTQPLTAVANTQLLTCQTWQPTNNSMAVDNGPGSWLATRSGNVSQSSMSPYGSGHSMYFNGGGSNGHLYPVGLYSKTGNVNSGSLNIPGAFTFECWVYLTAGGRHCMMGSSNGWAYTTDWGFCIMDTTNGASTSYNPGFCFMRSGTSGYGVNFLYATNFGYPTLNTWHHLAMCRDSSNQWHMYMDGVKGTNANLNSIAHAYVQFDANSGVTGTLGMYPTIANWNGFVSGGNGSQSAAGFNGYISDLRFVNGTALYTGASLTMPTQPLSPVPGTVVLLGQDDKFTNFADDKGFTYLHANASANNFRAEKFSKFNTADSPKLPISYSNYFDGTGDYLSTAVSTSTPGWNLMAPSGSGGGTVEAWIYVNSASRRIICGCLNIGASYTGWYLSISATGQLAIEGYIAGNAAGPAINSGAGLVALNTWTHIAVSCISGAVTFYINGVGYAAINPIPANWQINNTATATMVGEAYTPWNIPFLGYISNLRMINNAAFYTAASLTVPTVPLTTTVNTTLLTCKDATLKDNSQNAYAITAFGNAMPALANPFGFTVTTGTQFTPQVKVGSAFFDGTGDWLTVPHSPALDLNCDNWTVEAWVNMTGTAEMGVMGKRPGASYGGLIVSIRNQRLYFIGSSTNTTWTLNSGAVDGVTPVTPGWWTHIAVVKNGTTVYGFVNGKLDQTYTSVVNLAANTSNLTIGANSVTGEAPASGYISNFRIIKGQALYTQAFSPPTQPPAANKNTVLQMDMDKAPIVDATSSRPAETVGDARLITESAYNTTYYSNYFDGTGDSLTVPASAAFAPGTGNFTVEGWYYSGVATGNPQQIWAQTASGQNYFIISFLPATSRFSFTGNAVDAFSTAIATANTWNHFAVVRVGTSVTVYCNGIAGTPVTFADNFSNTTYVPTISGFTHSATYMLTGYLSNLRYVKGTALYTANFTPSTTPLTAVTNTQLLTCQSNKFIDNSVNNLTITRTGDTVIRSVNPFKRNTQTSMYFDGTGDYMYTPLNASYGIGSAKDFTIETWAYPIATGTARGIFQISATAGGLQASVSTTLAIGVTATNAVEIYTNGTSYTTTAARVPLGAWTHFALVRLSGVTKLYINGVLETSIGTAGSITDTTAYPNTSLVVGGYYGTSNLWNGYIEDFRVTKDAARYTGTFTPPAFKLANR
jgi:hypothetical protein